MSEPDGWAKSEEYVKKTIKRLADNQAELYELCRQIQVDNAVLKVKVAFITIGISAAVSIAVKLIMK